MKRILVASSYEHSPETRKRFIPEAWEDRNYKEEETKKEEEERIFREIKAQLKKENSNITIIKKPSVLGVTQILSDQFLYEPFTQVIHLVDTPSGIVPMEGDSRQACMFRNTRVIKKSKYTFSFGMHSQMLEDAEMKIVTTIYAVEGANVIPIQKYLDNPISPAKRLDILGKILQLAHSLRRKVLDPMSIFISEDRNVDAVYIPTERKSVSVTEYMMFLLNVLLNTYTVMERAIIVREMTMGINGRISEKMYRILRLVHKLVTSKEDTQIVHLEVSEYIASCMKSI